MSVAQVMNLRIYALTVVGLAALSVGAGYWIRSRRKTPEQRERARRDRLSTFGRITDGTVVDVQEISANGQGAVQLLIYSYDVAGVSYEASQERHSPAAVHRPALLPPGFARLHQVRPAESGQLDRHRRNLERAEKVGHRLQVFRSQVLVSSACQRCSPVPCPLSPDA